MTFNRANPVGWALFELLTSSQMNELDSQLPFALDGREGGTYGPTATIIVDGINVTGGVNPTMRLRDTPSKPALRIDVINGSGDGILVDAGGDDNGYLVDAQGGSLSHFGVPDAAIRGMGHANSINDGGPGVYGLGGETTDAGSMAGAGVHGIGGPGSGVDMRGGHGVKGQAGTTNYTGLGAGLVGTTGVHGEGSVTVGGHATHFGGPGVAGYGGPNTVLGNGGPGVYGEGALGDSSSVTNVDAGYGVAGRGSVGVVGVNNFLSPFELPAEFTTSYGRAGVRALAKSYGRAFVSEFSGPGGDDELNVMQWVGAGGGVSNFTTMFRISNLVTSAGPTGVYHTTGLQIDDLSTTSGNMLGLRVRGRARPAIELLPAANAASDYEPQLKLTAQGEPTSDDYVNGGMYWANSGLASFTGLLDDTLMIGSETRGVYDRVVTSGDRAAAQAWARITTDGAGNETLGSNYGVASCVITTPNTMTVTLDTIAGQPSTTSLLAWANVAGAAPGAGQICHVEVLSATVLLLTFLLASTGAAYDIQTNALEVHLLVFGAPAVGTAADRPTYFTP